jgi:hypothetical protein
MYQFKKGDKIKFHDSPTIWTIDEVLPNDCFSLKEHWCAHPFHVSILILVQSASFSLDDID